MIHRGKPLKENNRYALTNYYYQTYKIDKMKSQFKPMLSVSIFNDGLIYDYYLN